MILYLLIILITILYFFENTFLPFSVWILQYTYPTYLEVTMIKLKLMSVNLLSPLMYGKIANSLWIT